MLKKFVVFIVTYFLLNLSYANTVLIIGDSISAGFGLQNGTSWTDLLKQKLASEYPHYQLVNASISGDTTTSGVSRLPKLLDEYQPSVIIIELGGNDGLRATHPKSIEKNLNQMVEIAKNSTDKILLIGVELPPNYGQAYLKLFNAVFENVGNNQNIALLPSIVAKVGDKPELMQADGVHPNEKAQPIIFEDIFEKLKPLLEKTP